MSADRLADIFRQVKEPHCSELLDLLDPDTRVNIRRLLEYPRHTAGSIMTTEFASVPSTCTVGQALDYIRHVESSRERPVVCDFGSFIHEWHKRLLHEAVPPIIQKWERKLSVEVSGYFLQRMKTKWGSCNHRQGHIRLNTELVKKPKDLLEYVIAHEMAHLIEPTHSDRFIGILDKHYPSWREARAELNELPLTAEAWNERAFAQLPLRENALFVAR